MEVEYKTERYHTGIGAMDMLKNSINEYLKSTPSIKIVNINHCLTACK